MKSIQKMLFCLTLIVCTAYGWCGADIHLQTTDIIEATKTNSGWKAQLSRRVGIGMDAPKKTTFDATLSDKLPAGCVLISPKTGNMQVSSLDGKKKPVVLTCQKSGKDSVLQLKFKDLPTLLKGHECCACSGECDRACSVEFTYRLSLVNALPQDYKALNFSLSKKSIPNKKSSKVRVTISLTKTELRNSTLIITIPNEINGAKLAVAGSSRNLKKHVAPPGYSKFMIKPESGNKTFFVDLQVKPKKIGLLKLTDFAELVGESAKPIHKAPVIVGASRVITNQKTYFKLKSGFELMVK